MVDGTQEVDFDTAFDCKQRAREFLWLGLFEDHVEFRERRNVHVKAWKRGMRPPEAKDKNHQRPKSFFAYLVRDIHMLLTDPERTANPNFDPYLAAHPLTGNRGPGAAGAAAVGSGGEKEGVMTDFLWIWFGGIILDFVQLWILAPRRISLFTTATSDHRWRIPSKSNVKIHNKSKNM